MKLSTRKGFTLIELLVVITIIGLLAGIGIASFTRAQARGRDGRRTADMAAIQDALELYASENNGRYPSHAAWARSTDGDDWIPDLMPKYIKFIPKETYHTGSPYHYRNDGWSAWCTSGYIALAHLETESGKPCICFDGSKPWGGYWDCHQNP